MRKISEIESEIGNILNKKREKAYIDIYKETEFSGMGVLIDHELTVYKYIWNTAFNKDTHNFSINNYLYECSNKINYKDLESYLINELNIVEKIYQNTSNDMEKYREIIKLESYINEYFNKELYEKIINKISDMIKEDL